MRARRLTPREPLRSLLVSNANTSAPHASGEALPARTCSASAPSAHGGVAHMVKVAAAVSGGWIFRAKKAEELRSALTIGHAEPARSGIS